MPDPPPNLVDHLPMFVLDVMRYADSYDFIVKTINEGDTLGWTDCWGRDFTPVEIDSALEVLKEQGLIEESRHTPDCYTITAAGSRVWEEWIPPGKAGEREIIARALREWDPIGVFVSVSDWPQDEYESYVPLILDALEGGAGVDAISDLLSTVKVDYIGLSPDPDEDARIAKKLHAALTAHRQREDAGR